MAAVQERGATSGSACSGLVDNCGRLSRLGEMHAESCERGGIKGDEAMLSAAAVGLVIDVWRNGPVEDMHASRRGPSDAAMFAESTELHSAAVAALTSDDRCDGLLGFEDHLLDRSRPWAGTGGRTLSELGHGFLGHYRRHVKQQTNILMSLYRHTCVPDPLQLYLIPSAVTYGNSHKGMPRWPVIVGRIEVLLDDPDHPAWHDGFGHEALRRMPAAASSASDLAAALLARPADLPLEVLDWLSGHLLYCAGPPWASAWGSAAG
ncbi:hypothetical protein [Actinoplanes awajinensis]|uniref:Uncharacterized protein n=1 Tax=Actinoplanes awajinensis subsp. mycoplanecinus TaxID=135947 RepID=A0A0X3V6W4_9ACTN|nr:hypothetical protein [Actinoplanes awajinensis]KUL40543.1 hypothetical protein ADL15_07120 [Actinoplanes awajinensis subsp. mycoplanecinus]